MSYGFLWGACDGSRLTVMVSAALRRIEVRDDVCASKQIVAQRGAAQAPL